MEPTEALAQVAYLLAVTGGIIVGMELLLYGLLTFHRKAWLLLAAPLAGAALGAFFRWLGLAEETMPAMVSGAGVALTLALWSRFLLKGRYRIPILMLAPAFLAVCLLIVYPFFFELRLAFGDLKLYTIGRWLQEGELGFAGLKNFYAVFTESPLQTVTFWELLLRTFAWTGINLVFHVFFGLGLAMLLNRPMKLRGLYRTLLIVPWAMPQVVAILAWRGEFHPQFGMVNHILEALGLSGINWWSDPVPVFLSCCIVNIWLGIPFMMIVFLGGLQAIPNSYYEAASIDGASKWTQFREITLPMLKPVVVPSITLGTIWTFNNINVIYLMTGQDGGNEYADILVSALYKAAFTYYRYSYSAAFAIVIFAILVILTLVWMRVSRGTESAVG